MDIHIPGLAPGKAYDVAVSYRHRGKYSGRATTTVTTPSTLNATLSAAISGQGALATLSSVGPANMDVIGENLMPMPAFETETGYWSMANGWSIATDASNAFRGDKVATRAGAAGTNQQFDRASSANGKVAVTPGRKYIGFAWLKRDASANGTFNVRITWVDSSGTFISSSTGAAVTISSGLSTAYQMFAFDAAAPTNAFRGYARVTVDNQTAGNLYCGYVGLMPAIGLQIAAGDVKLGSGGTVYRDDGSTRLTDAVAVTALGTAAAVTGQSALATLAPPNYADAAAAVAALGVGHLFADASEANKIKITTAAAAPMTVTLSRYSQTKTRSGAGSVTSDAYASTVTGGSGTYTYAWEKYSGDGTINSPTGSSTTFSQTLAVGETKSGNFRLTVTDTVNSTTATVTCAFLGTEIT